MQERSLPVSHWLPFTTRGFASVIVLPSIPSTFRVPKTHDDDDDDSFSAQVRASAYVAAVLLHRVSVWNP